FQSLPASVTALKVLFDGWENWHIFADGDAKAHMIQTLKDINAQIIEDPSLTTNVGGQSVHAGKVIVSSVIEAGDLELPSADEEDEVQPEQTPAEAVLSGRRKRKG
ncbi:PREDICTED: LOC109946780, partial [Prunus dulcis]